MGLPGERMTPSNMPILIGPFDDPSTTLAIIRTRQVMKTNLQRQTNTIRKSRPGLIVVCYMYATLHYAYGRTIAIPQPRHQAL